MRVPTLQYRVPGPYRFAAVVVNRDFTRRALLTLLDTCRLFALPCLPCPCRSACPGSTHGSRCSSSSVASSVNRGSTISGGRFGRRFRPCCGSGTGFGRKGGSTNDDGTARVHSCASWRNTRRATHGRGAADGEGVADRLPGLWETSGRLEPARPRSGGHYDRPTFHPRNEGRRL